MTVYTGSEVAGLYLSGGLGNTRPSDSLGGLMSVWRVAGMYPQILQAVPGLRIEEATPECGDGVATVSISGGVATFTPPGGVAGRAVSLAEGDREFLTGGNAGKGVWVYRVAGLEFDGTSSFRLVDQMNGVVSMSDVQDDERQAGQVCYRAMFLKKLGYVGKSWLWITTDGQSSFSIAEELPTDLGGVYWILDGESVWVKTHQIQTISDEETPPVDLSWVDAISEATALEIPTLSEVGSMGIWIRRTFPASGVVAADEQVNFHLKVEEGG